ncbi:MAG TPA: hypothetical protein VMJ75_16130 [Candidatus Acidoferrales bacterium]|nr:hypothetical protein [Candidatus Acidoferrales bacterium]
MATICAGDQDGLKRINQEIATRYPRSEAAKQELADRLRRDYKYPTNADKAQMEAYRRAEAEQYGAWRKTWPQDSLIYNVLFLGTGRTAGHPSRAGRADGQRTDGALYRKNPNWYGSPPLEFCVADAYLKFKVNIDEAPALVKEGADAAGKRLREEMADDQIPEEMRTMLAESADNLKMERARILLTYYADAKQTEAARAIESELASLKPSKPGAQSTLLERQAQAAEVLGRKLDALVTYRAALDLRPPAPVRQSKSAIAVGSGPRIRCRCSASPTWKARPGSWRALRARRSSSTSGPPGAVPAAPSIPSFRSSTRS